MLCHRNGRLDLLRHRNVWWRSRRQLNISRYPGIKERWFFSYGYGTFSDGTFPWRPWPRFFLTRQLQQRHYRQVWHTMPTRSHKKCWFISKSISWFHQLFSGFCPVQSRWRFWHYYSRRCNWLSSFSFDKRLSSDTFSKISVRWWVCFRYEGFGIEWVSCRKGFACLLIDL